jgi:hypothetical protein
MHSRSGLFLTNSPDSVENKEWFYRNMPAAQAAKLHPINSLRYQ